MNVSTNYSNFSQQEVIEVKQDPAIHLPQSRINLIFSFLSVPSLLACMSVSKKWKQLTEDDGAWKTLAISLKIPNQTGLKDAVIEKLITLFKNSKETKPYLTKPVHSLKTLNRLALSFVLQLPISPEEKAAQSVEYKNLAEENEASLQALIKGFHTHLALYRIGLSSLVKLEEYASAIQHKHLQENYLQELIFKPLKPGDIEKAYEFFKELEEESDKYSLLLLIIIRLYRENQLDKAVEYFKEFPISANCRYKYKKEKSIADIKRYLSS